MGRDEIDKIQRSHIDENPRKTYFEDGNIDKILRRGELIKFLEEGEGRLIKFGMFVRLIKFWGGVRIYNIWEGVNR